MYLLSVANLLEHKSTKAVKRSVVSADSKFGGLREKKMNFFGEKANKNKGPDFSHLKCKRNAFANAKG